MTYRFTLMLAVACFAMTACGCNKQDNGGGSDEPEVPEVPEVFTLTPDRNYRSMYPQDFASKEYYFLSLLKNLPEMNGSVGNDEFLVGIAEDKFQKFTSAQTLADRLTMCRFSKEEIEQIEAHFRELWEEGNAWDRLVKEHLVPSGAYICQNAESAADLLCSAWQLDANSVNRIIDIFGSGSVAAHCDDDIKTATDAEIASSLDEITASSRLFFEMSLTAVSKILEANERGNEPVDFEPMADGCNKAAYEKMKTVNWDNYDYSVIMVPGAGPSELTTPLAESGKRRCTMGYELYKNGKAPFILVSGGRIHPMKTRYCEAEEMKKYLMDVKKVPEEDIIMEPHARHTPTNFRNVARILSRYAPEGKPALVACEEDTINNTFQSTAFSSRCVAEFGYMPVSFGKKFTDTSLEFYPVEKSLQISSKDPLDP